MQKWQWATLIVLNLITLWWNRWFWVQPFDYAYLENYFADSQWRIPNSPRVMSDNELYQVAGVRIVTKNDFFDTNPEVPPVGKYLYGLSAVWFGHPGWSTLLLWVSVLALSWLLTKEVLTNTHHRWLALLLLSLSPVFASQASQTMLDLPQLTFLLVHVWALCRLSKLELNRTHTASPTTALVWTSLAGISLGLFAGTKIAFFVPAILLVDTWLLWRLKRLPLLIALVGLTGSIYALTYSGYLLTHSLWAWLGAQKWIVHFYTSSQVKPVPLLALITSLTGWYQGWWGSGWTRADVWSITWPVVLVATGYQAWRLHQRRRQHLTSSVVQVTYITWLVIALFISNLLIPFWPRYFLLLLPFGLLIAAPKLNHSRYLMGFVLAVMLVQYVGYFRAGPENMLQFAQANWNKTQYLDFYSFLTTRQQAQFDRQHFAVVTQTAVAREGYKGVQITTKPTYFWQNQTTGTATLLLPNNEHRELPLTLDRESNAWKINWPIDLQSAK